MLYCSSLVVCSMFELVIADENCDWLRHPAMSIDEETIDINQKLYQWLNNNASGNWFVYLTIEQCSQANRNIQFWYEFVAATIRFEDNNDAILFKLSCM
jgi:hypothetical protein